MPLTKAQKALYEAALRRKGLQPGKAVFQDPRTFVGPVEMRKGTVPRPWKSDHQYESHIVTDVPKNTYYSGRGRHQDLENELAAAAGIFKRKNPMMQRYWRYYTDEEVPRGWRDDGFDYNDGKALSYHPVRLEEIVERPIWRGAPSYPQFRAVNQYPWHLTRMGELELEARADEMIENEYKDYLRKMYQRFPNREAVREQFPAEYNAMMPYLEDLFPEEY